jgi:hypothetical protein
MDQIGSNNYTAIVLMGDFNAHYSDNSSTGTFDAGAKLSHFIARNNLSQLIKEPTRITQTRSSILDLIITDLPSLFVSNGTLSPSSNCDHNVVVGEMSIPIYRPKFSKELYVIMLMLININ